MATRAQGARSYDRYVVACRTFPVYEDIPMLKRRRAFVAMAAAARTWLVAPARTCTQAVANPATPTKDPALQTGYALSMDC
jgi:hypothetical protein